MHGGDTVVSPVSSQRQPEAPSATLPRRSAPFDVEPGFYEPAGVWLYGNVRLLDRELALVPSTLGTPDRSPKELDSIEQDAERIVLDGAVLVCGVHNPAHQRAAVVPLRWGAPRVVVFSGGFHHHLGENLRDEPFRVARLWRYAWDPATDLAVSRRAPDKLPTFALANPSVDRLIRQIAGKELCGALFGNPEALRQESLRRRR